MSKGQTSRLTEQHIAHGGATGIFSDDAQTHDKAVGRASNYVFEQLQAQYPNYEFRLRKDISKQEINNKLKSIDKRLGETLFVKDSSIKPDGGVIEVKDHNSNWRIVLVSEAKFQGKDIENIKNGVLVGKNSDQIKINYCYENNIPLLVIKYTDYVRIDSILTEFINSLRREV